MKLKTSIIAAMLLYTATLQAQKSEFLLIDNGTRQYKKNYTENAITEEKALEVDDRTKLRNNTLSEDLKKAREAYIVKKTKEYLQKAKMIQDDLDESGKQAIKTLSTSTDQTQITQAIETIKTQAEELYDGKYSDEYSNPGISKKYDTAGELMDGLTLDNKILVGNERGQAYALPRLIYGSSYKKIADRQALANRILDNTEREKIKQELSNPEKVKEWMSRVTNWPSVTNLSPYGKAVLDAKQAFLTENGKTLSGGRTDSALDTLAAGLDPSKKEEYDKIVDTVKKQYMLSLISDINVSGLYKDALIGVPPDDTYAAVMALGTDGVNTIRDLNVEYNLTSQSSTSSVVLTAAQEGREDESYYFNYITLGDEPSTLTYNIGLSSISSFEINDSNGNSAPTIGKKSNLIVLAEENSHKITLKGIKVGFDDHASDKAQMIASSAPSSFKLVNKGDIEVQDFDNYKVYLSNGASFELISKEGDVDFNSAVNTNITEYDNKEYKTGQNASFKLISQTKKVNNSGFILASGENGNVNIEGKTGIINKVTDNKHGVEISNTGDFIPLKEVDNYGTTIKNVDLSGVIMAENKASVNLIGDVTNQGQLVNLGGSFNIQGSLDTSNGTLIVGQGEDSKDVGYFDVSNSATLGENTKIALALYPGKAVPKGGKAYYILKTQNGITGADSIKDENVYLLTLGKSNGKINIDDSKNANEAKIAHANEKRYLKVSLGDDDNKNLYYKLALSEEALSTPIEEMLRPFEERDIAKDDLQALKLSAQQIDMIKKISPTYNVSMFRAYEDFLKGDSDGEILTQSLSNMSNSIKDFSKTVAETRTPQNILNLNSNINTTNRLAKLSNHMANQFAMRDLMKELSDERYARSLIILSDVEDELVARLREKKAIVNNEINPYGFWVNAIGTKGSIDKSSIKMAGISIGMDRQDDDSIIGAYAMQARSSANNGGGIQSKTRYTQVGIYGRFFKENYELDVNGFYNIARMKNERNVKFFGDSLNYTSKGNSHNIQLGTSFGYVFDFADSAILKPSLGTNLYISKVPDLKEDGELALQKDGGINILNSLTANVELRYYMLDSGYFYFIPGLESEIYKREKNDVKFSGYDQIAQSSSSSKKTYATVLGGAELKMGTNSSFNLGLGTKLSGDEKYYNMNAGFKIKF